MSVSRSFFGRGGGEGRDEEDARVSTRGGSRPGGGLDPRTREGRKTFVRGVPTRIEKPFAPCGSSRGRGRGRAGGNPARARCERAAPPRPSRRGPRVRFGSAFALKESRHRRRGIRGGGGASRMAIARARGEKQRKDARAARVPDDAGRARGSRERGWARARSRARAYRPGPRPRRSRRARRGGGADARAERRPRRDREPSGTRERARQRRATARAPTSRPRARRAPSRPARGERGEGRARAASRPARRSAGSLRAALCARGGTIPREGRVTTVAAGCWPRVMSVESSVPRRVQLQCRVQNRAETTS